MFCTAIVPVCKGRTAMGGRGSPDTRRKPQPNQGCPPLSQLQFKEPCRHSCTASTVLHRAPSSRRPLPAPQRGPTAPLTPQDSVLALPRPPSQPVLAVLAPPPQASPSHMAPLQFSFDLLDEQELPTPQPPPPPPQFPAQLPPPTRGMPASSLGCQSSLEAAYLQLMQACVSTY